MSTEELHEEVVEVLDEEFLSADAETTCTICQAEFLDADDLTLHLHQIHNITTAGSKLCWFCSYFYSDLLDFAKHFRDKHLTELFFCVHCLRAFSDEDEHRAHERKHKRSYKNAFCCSQCCDKFNDIRELRKHDIEVHNNNDDGIVMQPHLPYLSSILNVKAETVLVSLRTDTVYICVACSYSTGSIHQFVKHSALGKCKTMVCERCSNVYKKLYTLTQHVVKVCGRRNGLKSVVCPDCNMVFSKPAFKEHKKVCRVIKCYTCNITYDTMYELSEHQSQEHPLSVELKACTFCWKQCVGSVALQKHIDRSHKADLHMYKYMCVYCKTPYKHPQKLFGHFFTKHKDIQPYTCTICNKTFRIRKRFTLHIKLDHKSEGYVEFDENYNVFFSDKKSDNPFIPKSLFVDMEKKDDELNKDEESTTMSLLNMNSEMSVTETEGNQTEVEATPKPTLKRKRGPKARKKETDETITIESSDDETLLVVKKRALKQQKQSPNQSRGRWSKRKQLNNRKRFTCNICNKYCYTFQNYNHHISLHSKNDFKKCIKCSKVFKSKEKLNQHVAMQHSSSRLTDTLKYMLEKRKKGESITDDLPMSEKFRRTIKKVEFEEVQTSAKIKEVDNRLSVQKFIENFTPEAENKVDIIINNAVTLKVVYGMEKEPMIKMTKFEAKPVLTGTKLSMPVKFKPGQSDKAPATIKLVQPVPIVQEEDSQDQDYQNYDDDNYNFMDRNDSIPEVAEEVMLEGTEEAPKSSYIPHKIVIPKLPAEYKDLRIAHLLPQAPYYKIVKVNEVLNRQNEVVQPEYKGKKPDLKLPDGTKLVNTNPLAHLLGKTPIEKVLEPLKNKYYKAKVRDFQGMLAEALSNLERPPKRRQQNRDESLEMLE
ncbi:hypothetical protein PYW07_012717 [Mythimna separata]|uniref:C2H2-type domain-containing protein n=1 Tax=Mythimna separata TaxID=271217 RepID=A0AAD8DKT8_MYTSE|nr:hypothetical protein PYW07_012717 [Mythimna separata]